MQLGYQRYGAQGGDWGAAVTTQIGRNGGHCAAIHLNMPLGFLPENSTIRPRKKSGPWRAEDPKWDSAYPKQQSTRPQTLGYGLVDSPVGRIAWIVEKFGAWTDCEATRERAEPRRDPRQRDDVWLTTSVLVGPAVLGELQNARRLRPRRTAHRHRRLPQEILKATRSWCEAGYNITHWTDMPRGGHFAAFEQPELFVEDVHKFFSTLR